MTFDILAFDADALDETDGGHITELEKFSPERMDGVANPASGFPILLMKSLGDAFAGGLAGTDGEAVRRREQQARKAREDSVRHAVAGLVAEHATDAAARLADLRTRISELEQSRRGTGAEASISTATKTGASTKQCTQCGRYSKSLAPQHRFCTQCGHRLDGGTAKGDAILAHDSAGAAKGPGLDALSDAEKVHLAALVAKCANRTSVDSIGELMKELGPHVAAKVIGGESVSPAEFTRAYLANGRAAQSAAAGQKPRIPDMSHVIHPEDFQRAPLTAGHERPTPLEMLQQAGQLGIYGTRG